MECSKTPVLRDETVSVTVNRFPRPTERMDIDKYFDFEWELSRFISWPGLEKCWWPESGHVELASNDQLCLNALVRGMIKLPYFHCFDVLNFSQDRNLPRTQNSLWCHAALQSSGGVITAASVVYAALQWLSDSCSNNSQVRRENILQGSTVHCNRDHWFLVGFVLYQG